MPTLHLSVWSCWKKQTKNIQVEWYIVTLILSYSKLKLSTYALISRNRSCWTQCRLGDQSQYISCIEWNNGTSQNQPPWKLVRWVQQEHKMSQQLPKLEASHLWQWLQTGMHSFEEDCYIFLWKSFSRSSLVGMELHCLKHSKEYLLFLSVFFLHHRLKQQQKWKFGKWNWR